MFHTQAFWFCTLRLNPPVRVPLPPLPVGGCRLRSTASHQEHSLLYRSGTLRDRRRSLVDSDATKRGSLTVCLEANKVSFVELGCMKAFSSTCPKWFLGCRNPLTKCRVFNGSSSFVKAWNTTVKHTTSWQKDPLTVAEAAVKDRL